MPRNEEFAEVQENNMVDQMVDDPNPAEGDELLKETERQLKRAKGAKHLDTKTELVNNVYPILAGTIEWVNNALQEIFELLAEDDDDEEDDEDIEEGIFVPYSLYDRLVGLLQQVCKDPNTDLAIVLQELVAHKEAELAREAAEAEEDDQDDEGEEE